LQRREDLPVLRDRSQRSGDDGVAEDDEKRVAPGSGVGRQRDRRVAVADGCGDRREQKRADRFPFRAGIELALQGAGSRPSPSWRRFS
jgi:hypothetical protein